MNTYSVEKFENLWNCSLSPIANRIMKRNFDFTDLTDVETEIQVKLMMKSIEDEHFSTSGPERQKEWEKGWSQNFDLFKLASIKKCLIPKYFGKNPLLRLDRKLILAQNSEVEYNFFETLMDFIYLKYIDSYNSLYEFGCGTSHNLVRIRELNSKIKLVGLDWTESSLNLGKLLNQHYSITNYKFDFFKPDYSIKIEDNSIVMTVAALEQVGQNYQNFVKYLLTNKVCRVINVEPINELLNKNDRLDRISMIYSKKRNYLSNYLDFLTNLEKENKVKIIDARRTYIGSKYLEGYSLVVWET